MLHAQAELMTTEEAAARLLEGDYVDYLHGRPLKLDFSRDEFRTDLYDRDNGGEGTCERIINGIR